MSRLNVATSLGIQFVENKTAVGADILNHIGVEYDASERYRPGKIKVESLNDLPRKVYPIDVLASELIVSDEFAALVDQVDADVSKLLSEYDIRDKATLQNLYRVLSRTALPWGW